MARIDQVIPRGTQKRESLFDSKLFLQILQYGGLFTASVIFLFPFLWLLSTALKDLASATSVPPTLLPPVWHWENFRLATEKIPFWTQAFNTVVLCILNVIGTTISCALVAYGFSRIEWPGRDLFFWVTVSTMMIPGAILLVPLYGMYRELGWIGTALPLWVPSFTASAYNIFLLRQFFMGIPKEVTEAAEIDGFNQFQIFFYIILPLTKPALTVVALFSFLYVWNDFMGPLIYLTDEREFTLALGLQAFQSRLGGTEINLLMAAAALVILPVMVLFLFAQRSIIEGISMTGLKS
ncbi:MAG: carbohydrate ABC transporter permease [Candidatus Sumerlaeia bacterium]|nr:carbohydrate ABC transporter permease [Candidatus Sumerlaeia bacterium]